MTTLRLLFSTAAKGVGATASLGCIAAATHAAVTVEFTAAPATVLKLHDNTPVVDHHHIYRQLVPHTTSAINVALIAHWIDFALDDLAPTTAFAQLSTALDVINHHLSLRSYIVGYSVSNADFAVWAALRAHPVFANTLKSGKVSLTSPHLSRWLAHISSLPAVTSSLAAVEDAKKSAVKAAKTAPSVDKSSAAASEVIFSLIYSKPYYFSRLHLEQDRDRATWRVDGPRRHPLSTRAFRLLAHRPRQGCSPELLFC